jgi:thiamine monophosphate synthase
MNDRVDLALAVDADGVHLGQQDIPIALARQLLGSQRSLVALPQIRRKCDARSMRCRLYRCGADL